MTYPDPVPLGGDGIDYEVLTEAAEMIRGIPGLTLDIGLRTGGSTKVIVDALEKDRTHVAIDPYGGLDYWFDGDQLCPLRFTNEEYRNPSLPKIYEYVFNAGLDFQFFNMTSAQFMRRFWDGVPTYDKGVQTIVNNYALVFFDGSHTLHNVLNEAVFFEWRTTTGSMLVFDDIDVYDHFVVDDHLRKCGWAQVTRTNRKVSYRKV